MKIVNDTKCMDDLKTPPTACAMWSQDTGCGSSTDAGCWWWSSDSCGSTTDATGCSWGSTDTTAV